MQHQMQHKNTIKLKHIVNAHHLNIAYQSTDYNKVEIDNYNVARPSLQLVGFYDYFDADRLLLWGKAETRFLENMPDGQQVQVVEQLFSRKIPALIVCNKVPLKPVLVNAAQKYDVTLLNTDVDTSELVAHLITTLRSTLAPRLTVHGVLIQVHGEGLLITGESGIGKSEVALELVKRGHRLVADDAVELRRMGGSVLEGCAPKMIRYLMELRGVGLIDVRRIFGVGAVLPAGRVDLVVNFVHWDNDTEYDRLGLEDIYTEYLGVSVPQITVPVAPARNLAIILEVAAMNNRQKKLGYNTAKEFLERHDGSIDSGDTDEFSADDFLF